MRTQMVAIVRLRMKCILGKLHRSIDLNQIVNEDYGLIVGLERSYHYAVRSNRPMSAHSLLYVR
jgi:hypothetical protein